VTLVVEDVRCGNKNDKVAICHNGKTICIAPEAVPAHLKQGQQLGACTTPGRPAAGEGASELAVYPNPMADQATVSFRAPAAGTAQVQVYNALGQRVATLHDGPVNGGQRYELSLKGQGLPTGLYQVRLVLNGHSESRQLLLAR
jgi:hypothetical protein